MPPKSTSDLYRQDWALIIEALVIWAGDPTRLSEGRQERAYEIVETIAAEQGVPPSELIASLDTDWSGPTSDTESEL